MGRPLTLPFVLLFPLVAVLIATITWPYRSGAVVLASLVLASLVLPPLLILTAVSAPVRLR